MSLVQLC